MARDIKCQNCGTLFGREDDEGALNIKHRDLYRTFRGGEVVGPCRRCAAKVKWSSDDSQGTR